MPKQAALISVETARFLLWIVGTLRPDASADDFPQATANIIRAKEELQAVIDANSEPQPRAAPNRAQRRAKRT